MLIYLDSWKLRNQSSTLRLKNNNILKPEELFWNSRVLTKLKINVNIFVFSAFDNYFSRLCLQEKVSACLQIMEELGSIF